MATFRPMRVFENVDYAQGGWFLTTTSMRYDQTGWRRQHAQGVWQAIQFTALLALHYDRCAVDFAWTFRRALDT